MTFFIIYSTSPILISNVHSLLGVEGHKDHGHNKHNSTDSHSHHHKHHDDDSEDGDDMQSFGILVVLLVCALSLMMFVAGTVSLLRYVVVACVQWKWDCKFCSFWVTSLQVS